MSFACPDWPSVPLKGSPPGTAGPPVGVCVGRILSKGPAFPDEFIDVSSFICSESDDTGTEIVTF